MSIQKRYAMRLQTAKNGGLARQLVNIFLGSKGR